MRASPTQYLRRPISLVAHAALLGLVLASGCGQNRDDSGSEPGNDDTVRLESRGRIMSIDGGTVKSRDGLFSVTVAAQAFDQDVVIVVRQLEDSIPDPAAALSEMYEVVYTPVAAVFVPGSRLEIEFIIDDAVRTAVIGDVAIGMRLASGGAYEQELPGTWRTDDDRPRLAGSAAEFASFVAIDTAAGSCLCDVSSSCDGDCSCDQDCGSTGCTSTQWTCGNGACIPGSYFCDEHSDCTDGSDELVGCDSGTDPGGTVIPGGDDHEPDNGFGSASEIDAGTVQTRSIHHSLDNDYVRFTLEGWADISLETDGASGDTKMELFDEAQLQLASNDDSGNGAFSLIEEYQMPPGIYYARIYDFGENDIIDSYTLSLTTTATGPVVQAPANVNAVLADGVIQIAWDPVATATSYKVYYDDDSFTPHDPYLEAAEGAPPIATDVLAQTLTGVAPGTNYYIWVTATDGLSESAYSQPATVPIPATVDIYEADDSFADARPIDAGDVQQHTIHVGGDQDYVYFVISETSGFVIETAGNTGDTMLRLYDAAENLIEYDDDGGEDRFSRIRRFDAPPGTYYAQVTAYSNTRLIGSYTLSLGVAPSLQAPTRLVAAAADGGVTLTWDAVNGATGYNVYYDDQSGEPYNPSILATEGGSPISVTETTQSLTGLPNGLMYYFVVSATNGLVEGPMSDEASASPEGPPDTYETDDDFASATPLVIGEPQEHSIHRAGDVDFMSFTLTEVGEVTAAATATSGTTRVTLYDGAHAEITKSTSAAGVLSFLTAGGLAAGDYFVAVSGYSASSAIPSYSIDITVRHPPAAPQNVAVVAEATAGSATVSWDAVEGATAYKLYFDDDSVWPYAGTVSGVASPVSIDSTDTSYIFDGLVSSQTYYFLVVTVVDTQSSDYSEAASLSIP